LFNGIQVALGPRLLGDCPSDRPGRKLLRRSGPGLPLPRLVLSCQPLSQEFSTDAFGDRERMREMAVRFDREPRRQLRSIVAERGLRFLSQAEPVVPEADRILDPRQRPGDRLRTPATSARLRDISRLFDRLTKLVQVAGIKHRRCIGQASEVMHGHHGLAALRLFPWRAHEIGGGEEGDLRFLQPLAVLLQLFFERVRSNFTLVFEPIGEPGSLTVKPAGFGNRRRGRAQLVLLDTILAGDSGLRNPGPGELGGGGSLRTFRHGALDPTGQRLLEQLAVHIQIAHGGCRPAKALQLAQPHPGWLLQGFGSYPAFPQYCLDDCLNAP
jgi:hypothetical protein